MSRRFFRTAANLVLGIGSLAALILVASLFVTSLVGPPLAGYEGVRGVASAMLLATLVAIVLVWARFIARSRQHAG